MAKEKTKEKTVSAPVGPGYIPRLRKIYAEKIAPELKEEFGYTSSMQVPKFLKVVVSMGVGEAKENKKILDAAVGDVGIITGQKAVKTKARTSIAVFKIREGQEIGCRVTLRGTQMWEFLDRLMNVALPRVKDFRGVNPNAFDGHGNYSMGLTEQIIFPEIDYDKIEKVMGMNVAIVTSARTDKEAKSLLAKMGMPFRK
jgi:large subunit ribosomal protein L5